jgi:DNA-binding response OmpR family regulator
MTKRVLIVEDEPDEARTYLEMLRAAGYEAQSAGNGREAVWVANEFHPDVMLVDIGLPDGNGLILARTLGMLHEAPVVIMTGLPSFGLDEPLSANPYVKCVLFKPCSSRTLLNAVEEAASCHPTALQ